MADNPSYNGIGKHSKTVLRTTQKETENSITTHNSTPSTPAPRGHAQQQMMVQRKYEVNSRLETCFLMGFLRQIYFGLSCPDQLRLVRCSLSSDSQELIQTLKCQAFLRIFRMQVHNVVKENFNLNHSEKGKRPILRKIVPRTIKPGLVFVYVQSVSDPVLKLHLFCRYSFVV